MSFNYLLRGTGTVSAKTRERVKRLAEEMDYVRDPLLSTIASSRLRRRSDLSRPTVAVLRPARANILRGFIERSREAAEASGLDVIDEPMENPERDLPGRLRQLHHRGVLGLWLDRGLVTRAGQLPDEAFAPFAVLGIEWDPLDPRFTVVRRTRSLDFRRLMAKAAERGYRRPGMFIQLHPQREIANDFMRMGLAALEAGPEGIFHRLTGGPVPPPLQVDFGPGEYESARIAAWLKAHGPDCVLAVTPWVKRTLDALGYQGGFACEALGGELELSEDISGMVLPHEVLARAAVIQIDTMIRSRNFGVPPHPLIINVPREWREGETLPPREPAAGSRGVHR